MDVCSGSVESRPPSQAYKHLFINKIETIFRLGVYAGRQSLDALADLCFPRLRRSRQHIESAELNR
jgi:hypothetical protein